MMADLVRDDIRLGKIAGGAETRFQVAIEAQIKIDFFVLGAIKRPDGRAGESAGRIDLPAEQHQLRLDVVQALLGEQIVPNDLSVFQHDGDEPLELVFAGRGRALPLRSALLRALLLLKLLLLLEELDRIAAEQPHDERDDQHSGAAADGHRSARHAALILDVVAAFLILPAHDSTPFGRLGAAEPQPMLEFTLQRAGSQHAEA